jgi:hypothetical protein
MNFHLFFILLDAVVCFCKRAAGGDMMYGAAFYMLILLALVIKGLQPVKETEEPQ